MKYEECESYINQVKAICLSLPEPIENESDDIVILSIAPNGEIRSCSIHQSDWNYQNISDS